MTVVNKEDDDDSFVVISPLAESGCWVALHQREQSVHGCAIPASAQREGPLIDDHEGNSPVWLYIPHGRAAALQCRTLCNYHLRTSHDGNPKAVFCFASNAAKNGDKSASTGGPASCITQQIAHTDINPTWMKKSARRLFDDALGL